MTLDLFGQYPTEQPDREIIIPGAILLRHFVQVFADGLLNDLDSILAQAPCRQMITPGGRQMSAAITNCGDFGWVSDSKGYRYTHVNPATQAPWPVMPEAFRQIAELAAESAGYASFAPDVCLINRYLPGAKMGLHQDKDERDFSQPIVSVSLGIPAVFVFGGLKRNDPCQRIYLGHNDVVVWGGAARLCYHAIQAIKDNTHPVMGKQRINLTFRKSG
jgi:DNA oxidative demethylase